MTLGEFSRQEEAHPHPPLRVRETAQGTFVDAMEALEDRFKLIVRDAHARIAHADDRILLARVGPAVRASHDRDGDRSPSGRVADRITHPLC